MTVDEPAARRPAIRGPEPGRRLRRAERREQIIDAAARAFARAGFADTSLDDVAAEAGITRALLYRHFDSKADMYRAVLDRACVRFCEQIDVSNLTEDSIPLFVRAGAEDPDGFRLLFRHAARESEFSEVVDTISAASVEIAHENLKSIIPDSRWAAWAARLIPAVTIEAVIAWLDTGQPDPDQAAARISQAVRGIIAAAQAGPGPA